MNKTLGQAAYEAWRALPSTKQRAAVSGGGFGAISTIDQAEWETIAQAVIAEAIGRLAHEDDPTGYLRELIGGHGLTIPIKPTKPLRAELVERIKARLSETCKCGHHKANDHYHGECEVEDCKCVMPDIAEELEADDELLKRTLECLESP